MASRSAGPHTARAGVSRGYRGSRKRLSRISMREHTSPSAWLFLILMLAILSVILPWLIHQALDQDGPQPRGVHIGGHP